MTKAHNDKARKMMMTCLTGRRSGWSVNSRRSSLDSFSFRPLSELKNDPGAAEPPGNAGEDAVAVAIENSTNRNHSNSSFIQEDAY